MKPEKSLRRIDSDAVITAAYFATLGAFFLASFFPDSRVWGFNIWAFFSVWVRLGLLALGVLAYFGARTISRGSKTLSSGEHGGHRSWYAVAGGLVALMTALFVIFRTTVHFLGDGYLVLSILSSPTPDVTYRELGEYLIHLWVFKWLAGTPPDRALSSYQLVSYISGAASLVTVSITAAKLFDRFIQRLLFVLGAASSGFMLLYFGYVEHYSVYSFAFVLFICVALLSLEGKLRRWVIVLPLVLALFLHIVGTTLIPAAIYVLFAGTGAGRAIASWSRVKKTVAGALVVLPLLAILAYYYRTDLFFQTAFVAPVATRFTVGGYTLFSTAHLIDMVNLMFLHLPGVALVIAALVMIPKGKLLAHAQYRFLAVLLLCVWGAAFIFEAKLGMPRDWDLFSFAGLPLAVSSAFFLADSRVGPSQKLVTAALVAALGFLSLVPRVAGQHIPKVGLAQVDSYARLDTVKNKNLTLVARNYFLEEGDSRDAKVEEDKWAAYPEERLLEQADIAVRSGSYPEAIASYRQALAANPINIPTYVYLGQLYNRLGQFDSAVSVMEIARGLAPRNPGVNTTLGLAYWSSGKKTKGERLCRFAIRLDPTMAKPYYYLANMCRESGREAEYESNLAQAVSKTDATAAMLADMAELEAERGDYQPAALNFRRAMDKGMDSSRVRRVVQKHPQLSRYLPGL